MRVRSWLACGVAATALTAAGHAAAQSAGLEEIVVTAQKREQRLQDVPVSVNAYSAERLEAANVIELKDLAKFTPGLYFETLGLSRPQIYIRGIGSGQFDAGTDPSVAVFVDDVYLPRFAAQQVDLFDLERVEVLKGPQGTLFGRNTEGGAISIVTRAPSFDPYFKAAIGYGEYNLRTVEALASGKLADKVAGKISVSYRARDGYGENRTTGRDVNDDDALNVRAQIKLVPTDELDVLLTAEFGRDDIGQAGYKNLLVPISQLSPAFAGRYAAIPDRRDEFYSNDGFQKRDVVGLSGRVTWASKVGTLTSITSFRREKLEELQDFDATAADSFSRGARERDGTFSQELRLASDNTGSLRWIGGLFYMHERTFRADDSYAGTQNATSVAFNGGRPFVLTHDFDIRTNSYAAYGQLTYSPVQDLNISAGARWSEDQKKAQRDLFQRTFTGAFNPFIPQGPYSIRTSETWRSFDPQLTVDYKLQPDVMVYASYRRGFKSGGFQPAPPATPLAASKPFAPEHVTSYEAGLKSQFYDRRVQFNLAAFQNKYRNLQFLAVNGESAPGVPLAVITNAGEATARGIESEVAFVPVPGLELRASHAFLDAKLDKYQDPAGNNLKGRRLIRAPRHQVTASAQYTWDLQSRGSVTLRGELFKQSRVFFEPINALAESQGGYTLLNARLTYETADKQWRVALYGKNLTDKLYWQNIIALANNTTGIGYAGAPRIIGATVTYKYN